MAVEDGSCDQIIADLSHTDKAQSVCVEVNECQDKIERDLKDNEKSQTVVIRIEPTAEAAAANEIRQNTDSLNSNNSCEKHENPSLSMTESENTSESISSSEEGDGDGVSNPAFVEDEEETEDITKKKKGHQRKPSCSPNKDIENISGGSGEKAHISSNPPILTEDLVDNNGKNDKQYTEYFMPTNEYKTQLGDYKKTKKSPTVAKIFCWIISCLLLTGAIILAVLIGTGIIQTDPNKNIKVSRKLEPEKVFEEEFPVQLMEVKIEDAPNVLTNDPEFFANRNDVKHFDGEFRITNVEWNSDLEDNTSYRYRQLADVIKTELDQLLSNFYENFDFKTSVKELKKGSIIVYFDLEAKSKDDGSNVINEDNILDAIANNLEDEFGYLFGKFIVPSGSLMIREKQSETSIYVILEDEEENNINNLEHQLESYESETFSHPRLETITEIMSDRRTLGTTKVIVSNISENITTSTTTTLADTNTQQNETEVAHQSGVIEFESTTSLEDITENETETKTNLEIISTRNKNIIESNDKDLLSAEIESRTDIYDQSQISDETQTEYFETKIVNLERDDIELEYIKAKDNEEDYDIYNNENEVTTDVSSLEVNTFNSNIINS